MWRQMYSHLRHNSKLWTAAQAAKDHTNSLDVEVCHELISKLPAELPQLWDGQVLQQAWDGDSWDEGLLGGFVHARSQLGQNLVVCNACRAAVAQLGGHCCSEVCHSCGTASQQQLARLPQLCGALPPNLNCLLTFLHVGAVHCMTTAASSSSLV